MTSNYKSHYIILLCLTLLTLATGCGKPDLSEVGRDITCYAATYSKGVYRSDNGGTSWYLLDPDHEDLNLYFKKLFLSPDKGALYVTTTGAGLFIMDTIKGSLDSVTQFKSDNVRAVAFRNSSPIETGNVEILAGMDSRGIFITRDGAGNWEDFNNGLTYHDVNALFKEADSLYAGTIKGLFKLDETSGIWTDISGDIKNRDIFAIDADPKGETIYAGAGVYQDKKGRFENIPCLYKSTDKGKTWNASDKGLPDNTLVYAIAVNAKRPERIYLGTSEGIFRSTNSGKKWSKMRDGLPKEFKVFDIKIVHAPDDKDLVYAASSSGVFMTLDDKKGLWSDRSYGLEKTNITSIVLGSSPN
jgi:ligand-binding sensor domain-containing protein